MNKKCLGQFYTTNYKHIMQNMYIPDNISNIIEPFAGNGDLLNFLEKDKYNVKCYDIEPKKDFIIKQDTLLNPPDLDGSFIITNPPYLARNKCDNKNIFNKYNTNDLYKCFIQILINSKCLGGIIIIPLNFICSIRKADIELRENFIKKYNISIINIFEEQVFDDTSYSICSFQFSAKDDRNIPINNFDDLRKVYKEITKENLRNMRDIAKQVEIVAKFSDVSPEFKKGGWLKAFAESQEKDPIKYAIKHNIKIDGMDPKQYVVSTIIDEYLQEKDPVKQALLENKYKAAAKELEGDKSLDKNNKTARQSVLENIIDQYLKADSPGVQKGLKEKYAAVQKLGEEQAPKLLTMDSNLGKFLSNPKAPEIVANHKHLKGQSALAPENIDYTKCDLPLIAKCKEVHEKSTKSRDYDKLSTIQKVGMAFATV